jgi:predicted transcriptional regulator
MAEEGSETTNSGGEAQNESDRHFWLRVRDPRIVRFRGVDTETHARHSNELARLKAVFAPSESARTAAELELARRTAEVETLKIQLMSEQSMASSFDSNAIKHKIREIEKKHARIATLLARNVDIILPELYAELAKLQSTPILWADYNLKFSRLHFQRAKIDKVLQSLLRQRSKNVLLAHALEEEKQQHLRLYALMNAYHSDVSQFSKEWSNRIDVLQRANDNHLPPALLTATLSRVHQLLTGTTAFNLQKMKSKAKEQAEIKKSLCDDGISQLESSELGRLRQSVDHFYAVLYKDHHGKHPHMTSPLVAEACRKTESATSKLASSLECLLKEYTSRSRAISELPKELQFERNLWVKFYGGSSQAKQLRAAFDEIKSGHASGLLLT